MRRRGTVSPRVNFSFFFQDMFTFCGNVCLFYYCSVSLWAVWLATENYWGCPGVNSRVSVLTFWQQATKPFKVESFEV